MFCELSSLRQRVFSLNNDMTITLKKQFGFTLIEVLVVVTIIVILTSLLVPNLRTVNKERGLRETARATGSIFAQASQRAIADGVSGVLLRHNPNFADGTGFSNSITSMSLLRAVPVFTGDQPPAAGIGAYRGSPGTIVIPVPIEQTDLEIVKSGDQISFGQSSVRYTITNVALSSGSPATLELDLDVNYLPDPNDFVEMSMTNPGTAYVVYRLPRVLQSSEVTLPRGFHVDLRFSGFTMLDSGFSQKPVGATGAERPIDSATSSNRRVTNVFEPNPRLRLSSGEIVDFTSSDIAILFNAKGELDRMVRLGADSTGATHLLSELAVDDLRLLVTEIDTLIDTSDPADNPLNSATNLWVTVNRSTGSANVGYNDINGSQTTLDQLNALYLSGMLADRLTFNDVIRAARGFSTAQTAAQ